jgi:hypothetical protein
MIGDLMTGQNRMNRLFKCLIKKNVRVIQFVVCLAFLIVVPAHAGDLYTPPVGFPASSFLVCSVLNIGKQTITVNVEAWSVSGLLQSSTCVADPSEGCLNGAIAPSGNYCKFSFPGSKKKIRAAARLFDSNTGELIGVIAAQ